MKESTENPKKRLPESADKPYTHASEGEVYLYQESGIQERHGSIPLWLKLVSIGLLVWAVYYTIRYWNTS